MADLTPDQRIAQAYRGQHNSDALVKEIADYVRTQYGEYDKRWEACGYGVIARAIEEKFLGRSA